MKYLLLLICTVSISKIEGQIQAIFTPNPAYNAVVAYPYPNTNSPVNPLNYVAAYWTGNGTHGAWRSFFKIDLSSIPANAIIDSAYFSFYADPNSTWGITGSPNWGNQNSARICRVTSVWNTNQFSWSTQPSYTTTNAALLSQSASVIQHYLHINAKNLIQDIMSNVNNGFAFTMQNETNYYNSQIFYSSAVPGNPQAPKLTVYYNNPLPLDLLSFTASNEFNTCLLKWEAANMINVSGFEIERSSDAISFINRGQIAAGSDGEYTFTDNMLLDGLYYYRLKMMDQDGKFSYSHSLKVLNTHNCEIVLYPNPLTNELHITSSSPNYQFCIYDMYGSKILEGTSMLNRSTVQCSQLHKGVYFIRIESDGETKALKFIKE